MSKISTASVSMVTAPSDDGASSSPDLEALSRDLARSRRKQRAHVADILASRHNQEATLEAILRIEKLKEESFIALRQAQAEHHVQLRAFIDSIGQTYGAAPGNGDHVPSATPIKTAPPTPIHPMTATALPVFPSPPPRQPTESLLGLGIDDEDAGLEIAQSESDSSTEEGSVEWDGLGRQPLPPTGETTPSSKAAQFGSPSPDSTPKGRTAFLPPFSANPSRAPTIAVARPRPRRIVLESADKFSESSYATATEAAYAVDVGGARSAAASTTTPAQPEPQPHPQPQTQIPYCCDWNWYDVCYQGTFCPRGALHACWNCHPAGEPSHHQARDCVKVLAPGSFRWVE